MNAKTAILPILCCLPLQAAEYVTAPVLIEPIQLWHADWTGTVLEGRDLFNLLPGRTHRGAVHEDRVLRTDPGGVVILEKSSLDSLSAAELTS